MVNVKLMKGKIYRNIQCYLYIFHGYCNDWRLDCFQDVFTSQKYPKYPANVEVEVISDSKYDASRHFGENKGKRCK